MTTVDEDLKVLGATVGARPAITPMTPEDIARQQRGKRPGFELVGYQEVGIPHWQLKVACVILSRKTVPPLSEFALKAMDSGLTSLEDISGFLGLSGKPITAVLAQLYQDGFIRPIGAGQDEFELTRAGQVLLEECEIIVPEETTFTLDYDGWTRSLVDLGKVIRDSASDLKKLGIWALPAFPADAPTADDLSLAQVRSLVQSSLESRRKGTVVGCEVLSIEGLREKRRVFYRRGVALLFQSTSPANAPQVAFAIDGRPSQEHEDAFAMAAGLKKLGVLEALKQSATDSLLEALDPDIRALLNTSQEVGELAQISRHRKREVIERQQRLTNLEGDPAAAELESESLEQAEADLALVEARLTQYPVRMLEVFEHPDVLKESLAEAQERLLIVSPWIKDGVVNEEFLTALEACLDRGVAVTIGFGINKRKPEDGCDPNALRRLSLLADRFENFTLAPLGDSHAKVLVLDHRHVVLTSFNWLSFRGDPSRAFRDERGFLVAIPAEIDKAYESLMSRVRQLAGQEEASSD